MVATINLKKCTGASAGTATTVTTIALKSVDDATGAPTEGSDAPNHPVTIPSSGTNYSYETWLKWTCETTAPDNQVTNFQAWNSGTLDTGLNITANSDAVSSGATPVNTDSAQGTRANFANWTSANKISVSGTLTGTSQSTNFLVIQLEVSDTATQGDMTAVTLNYSYDES